jgi:hypothetical protein
MKKNSIQIALLLVLLCVGIYFWGRLFQPPAIQILCTIHRERSGNPSAGSPRAIAAFGLDQRYELTSIKVVTLAEWKTNKNACPLWHLTSKTAPTPVKALVYGQKVDGMDSVSGADAEPLASKVEYLLLIEAGRRHGECEFMLP